MMQHPTNVASQEQPQQYFLYPTTYTMIPVPVYMPYQSDPIANMMQIPRCSHYSYQPGSNAVANCGHSHSPSMPTVNALAEHGTPHYYVASTADHGNVYSHPDSTISMMPNHEHDTHWHLDSTTNTTFNQTNGMCSLYSTAIPMSDQRNPRCSHDLATNGVFDQKSIMCPSYSTTVSMSNPRNLRCHRDLATNAMYYQENAIHPLDSAAIPMSHQEYSHCSQNLATNTMYDQKTVMCPLYTTTVPTSEHGDPHCPQDLATNTVFYQENGMCCLDSTAMPNHGDPHCHHDLTANTMYNQKNVMSSVHSTTISITEEGDPRSLQDLETDTMFDQENVMCSVHSSAIPISDQEDPHGPQDIETNAMFVQENGIDTLYSTTISADDQEDTQCSQNSTSELENTEHCPSDSITNSLPTDLYHTVDLSENVVTDQTEDDCPPSPETSKVHRQPKKRSGVDSLKKILAFYDPSIPNDSSVVKILLEDRKNWIIAKELQRTVRSRGWKPLCRCNYGYTDVQKEIHELEVEADNGYFLKYIIVKYALKTYNEFHIETNGLGNFHLSIFIDDKGNINGSVEIRERYNGQQYKFDVIIKNLETEASMGYEGWVVYSTAQRPFDFQFGFGKLLFDSYFVEENSSEVKEDKYFSCSLIVTRL